MPSVAADTSEFDFGTKVTRSASWTEYLPSTDILGRIGYSLTNAVAMNNLYGPAVLGLAVQVINMMRPMGAFHGGAMPGGGH